MLELALLVLTLEDFPLPAAQEPKLVAPARVVQLVSGNAVRRACAPSKPRFSACTQFVGWDLAAPCVSNGSAWSMQPKARYIAFVFIADRALVPHELLHVRDVESDVMAHLSELERGFFSSATACEEAARAVRDGFPAKLRDFAGASQKRRR